jgi:hypothetical protein
MTAAETTAAVTITQYATVRRDLTAPAYAAYHCIFEEVNTLAVNRHMLTPREFDQICANNAIIKVFATTAPGEVVGLSCITNDLESWPLISPEYFARHYPEHYDAGAIWWIGYVGVRPGQPGSAHLFRDLIAEMYPYVRDSETATGRRGIWGQDFCGYNVQMRRMIERSKAVVEHIHGAPISFTRIDEQVFVLGEFSDS